MVIENESRLTAVREGRVLDGKIQIEGSSETFTLVLSNKEVVIPEIMGPDAYGEIDPIHVSDREYGKVRFYNDTEECLYKGDRGNILYFSARSTSCNTPCGDMNELIRFVLYGPHKKRCEYADNCPHTPETCPKFRKCREEGMECSENMKNC